jgi:hypothetical protein
MSTSVDLLLATTLFLVALSCFAAGYFWALHRLHSHFDRRVESIRRREFLRAQQSVSRSPGDDIIDAEVIE